MMVRPHCRAAPFLTELKRSTDAVTFLGDRRDITDVIDIE
jgi:hypothetical protein